MKSLWHICCNPKVIAISVTALIVGTIVLIWKWNDLAPYIGFIIPVAALIGCMIICPLAMFIMMRQMDRSNSSNHH